LPVHIRHNPVPPLKVQDATKTGKQESVWIKQAETHFGRYRVELLNSGAK
jgi:hypothetical protein